MEYNELDVNECELVGYKSNGYEGETILYWPADEQYYLITGSFVDVEECLTLDLLGDIEAVRDYVGELPEDSEERPCMYEWNDPDLRSWLDTH